MSFVAPWYEALGTHSVPRAASQRFAGLYPGQNQLRAVCVVNYLCNHAANGSAACDSSGVVSGTIS